MRAAVAVFLRADKARHIRARHEHHRRPTAHGGDEGLVAADTQPSAITDRPGRLSSQSGAIPERKSRNTRENHRTRPPRPKRFYTTKTPCGSSHGADSPPLLPRMTLGFS